MIKKGRVGGEKYEYLGQTEEKVDQTVGNDHFDGSSLLLGVLRNLLLL
jgi:hypothetical protein